MKYNIFFIFFLFVINLVLAQDFVATYSVKLDNDKVSRITEATETLKFKLKVKNLESLFEMENELSVKDDFYLDLAKAGARGFDKFYLNLKTNKKILKTIYIGQPFLIETELKKQGWNITKEKRKIGNFTCYKATKPITVTIHKTKKQEQREVIAWFCPKIASRFGPIGYHGLPGLILELNYNNYVYYLDNINYDIKTLITIPNKGKKVTQMELDKVIKDSQPK